jgi:hypothetical protein
VGDPETRRWMEEVRSHVDHTTGDDGAMAQGSVRTGRGVAR